MLRWIRFVGLQCSSCAGKKAVAAIDDTKPLRSSCHGQPTSNEIPLGKISNNNHNFYFFFSFQSSESHVNLARDPGDDALMDCTAAIRIVHRNYSDARIEWRRNGQRLAIDGARIQLDTGRLGESNQRLS